ncbi:helix-turn-helix domain-containing protein [Chitinophaga sp. Cy-1792]|uniref:winged helix-turn-helix transcriptional regulator n=1 Tax=Chitinophaga sp. Cy-1792 TaxID=2608339 RepID=UPI0014212BA6|nr:helix-turn-helix domain-containing protein [Chitinophaga sp. Cy-1792]NIG52833.1 helix-turn-helix transcriptional regulator [Chitinophaga sp. Cy-1792]
MKKPEKNNNPTTICAVDYAFQRIGGKHKGRLLYHLAGGTQRYGELGRRLTGITPKMLTQVLRELEEDGLISRRVYLEVPPKVEYSLTATGRELIPFIMLLAEWGRTKILDDGHECYPIIMPVIENVSTE